MSSPKITAALSVYNVEEYLPRCLDCIVNQTFKDFEILCIDDCSTDNTYSILEEYAACDNRIRVIRLQKNAGLSVSRNIAIAEAKGDYIWMLDGDDLFEPDLLDQAYNAGVKTNADITIWDYQVFEQDIDLDIKPKKVSNLININKDNYHRLLTLPSFMWIRLYKLDFLRRLNIEFTPGLTKQDIPINWKTLTNKPVVAVVPKVMSYYRMRATSTTNRKGKSLFSLYKVMDIVGENLKQDNVYDEYRDDYLTQRLQLLQGMYDFILPEFKDEALSIIKTKCAESDVNLFLDTKLHLLSKRTQLFFRMIRGSFIAKLQYKGFLLLRDIYRKVKRG